MNRLWSFLPFFLGLIGVGLGVSLAIEENSATFAKSRAGACSWVQGIWTCSEERGVNFPSNTPSPVPFVFPVPNPTPSSDPNECDIVCIILIVVCVLIAIAVGAFIYKLRQARRKGQFLGINDFNEEAQQQQEKEAAEKAALAQAAENKNKNLEESGGPEEREVEPEPENEMDEEERVEDDGSEGDGSTIAVDSVDANITDIDEATENVESHISEV